MWLIPDIERLREREYGALRSHPAEQQPAGGPPAGRGPGRRGRDPGAGMETLARGRRVMAVGLAV